MPPSTLSPLIRLAQLNLIVVDSVNANGDNYFYLQEKQIDHLPRLKEKVTTPERVPRLFDLIKVQDEKMKLAFFAALGNTVVTKDIDQVCPCIKVLIWIFPSLGMIQQNRIDIDYVMIFLLSLSLSCLCEFFMLCTVD